MIFCFLSKSNVIIFIIVKQFIVKFIGTQMGFDVES